jgi:hypothetical protein
MDAPPRDGMLQNPVESVFAGIEYRKIMATAKHENRVHMQQRSKNHEHYQDRDITSGAFRAAQPGNHMGKANFFEEIGHRVVNAEGPKGAALDFIYHRSRESILKLF